MTRPYAYAAHLYREAGWANPIPVSGKTPPVSGYTGTGGLTVSGPDVQAWTDGPEGSWNIGLRYEHSYIGLDVDSYNGKSGAETLAELEARLGPLPGTWRSTARTPDNPSGIRPYRVPEGRHWVTKLNGIEVIQFGHRYQMAWPSIHPDLGTEYRWYDADGHQAAEDEVPSPSDFPELPGAWIEYLEQGEFVEARRTATDAEVEAYLAEHVGEKAPERRSQPLSRFIADEGASRHDRAKRAVVATAYATRAGAYPARKAFADLERLFVDSFGPGDRVTPRQAQAEFWSLVSWAVAQVKDQDPDELWAEMESRAVELTPLESWDFWTCRPELAHIREAAHSRGAEPYAVLHGVLARIASMQSPQTQIDIGLGPIGLNYFVCLVAESGGGKSLTMGAVRDLVPVPMSIEDTYRDGYPVGSGEGIPELFMGWLLEDPSDPKSRKYRGVARHNAYIVIDEGEVLTRLGERSGSTLGIAIRSAFSCKTIGQQNATEDRTRIVPEGQYSIGLVVAYQPELLGTFFSEAAGGTPQRFAFAPVSGPTVPRPRDRGDWPGPIIGPESDWKLGGWPVHRHGLIPVEADAKVEELLDRQWLIAQGEITPHPLNAHETLIIPRIATLLFLLSGRDGAVSTEDWDLAEHLWRVSCGYRDALYADHKAQGVRSAEAAGRLQGVREHAARVAFEQRSELADRVREALQGDLDGVKVRDLAKRIAGGRGDYEEVKRLILQLLPDGYAVETVRGRGAPSQVINCLSVPGDS